MLVNTIKSLASLCGENGSLSCDDEQLVSVLENCIQDAAYSEEIKIELAGLSAERGYTKSFKVLFDNLENKDPRCFTETMGRRTSFLEIYRLN